MRSASCELELGFLRSLLGSFVLLDVRIVHARQGGKDWEEGWRAAGRIDKIEELEALARELSHADVILLSGCRRQ